MSITSEQVKTELLDYFGSRINRDPRYSQLKEKFGDTPDLWEFLTPTVRELLEGNGLTVAQRYWLDRAATCVAALINNDPVPGAAIAPPERPVRKTGRSAGRYNLTKDMYLPALEAYINTNGAPNVVLRIGGEDVAVGQLTPDGSINIGGVVKTPTAWLNEAGGTGSGNAAWRLASNGKPLAEWYRELVASGASHRD